LLVDIEVPYADARQWKYWLKDERSSLPEAVRPTRERKRASDGFDYALTSRVLDLDPLAQHVIMEIHAERWHGETLEDVEDHRLNIGLYFKGELLAMLGGAGFSDIVVHGDHVAADPTSDDEFLVFVATKCGDRGASATGGTRVRH